jgi:prephenate dehydrogenase
MKKIKKIVVIGMGHMGKWFARELAKNHDVVVYDRNAKLMKELGKLKKLRSLEELAAFQPELLFNSVSIQNTIEAFRKAAPYLPNACIIADITSVKDRLAEYYQTCGFPFVSLHPMFGPRFANLNKIKGENIIFIKESDARAINFFKQFIRPYSLRTWDLSFLEHDEMMAYSLSLPFAATIAFSACIKGQEVPGTTFSRHMQIAQRLLLEDDNLLTEILFNPHSLKRLDTICTNMEFLKHIIRARDREEIAKLLARLRRNIQPHVC